MTLLPVGVPGFADPFSSLSHLIAAGAFAVLSVPLVRRGVRTDRQRGTGPTTGRVSSLVIFAVSAVLLLAMSGVFHLLGRDGTARMVFQRLDHAAIFLLIAGTFTPIHVIMFRGPARWAVLAGIWGLALLGVVLKSIFFVSVPPAVGLWLYIGMGWLGAFSFVALARQRGVRFVLPMVLGGVAYTAGAVVEWLDPAPLIQGVIRAHEIFHVAVIAGLGLHWAFISRIAGVTRSEAHTMSESFPPELGSTLPG